MRIDPVNDELITFAELAEALPRRGGRSVSVATVHRWRQPGLRGGIRLEAVRTGGIWRTTWPAFRAFVERCSITHDKQRQLHEDRNARAVDAANEQLDACNW